MMSEKKKSLMMVCSLSEEEAKAILRRVKIHTAGITLAADKAKNGYGWDVYATWTADEIKKMHHIPSFVGEGYEERFVEGYVTQMIISMLAKAVVELMSDSI
jgi:hypothetical protein